MNLFGKVDLEKQSNDVVVGAFRSRLRDVAGFQYVPEPIPMRNSRGRIIYYLFFASQNETASKIAGHILKKLGRTRTS